MSRGCEVSKMGKRKSYEAEIVRLETQLQIARMALSGCVFPDVDRLTLARPVIGRHNAYVRSALSKLDGTPQNATLRADNQQYIAELEKRLDHVLGFSTFGLSFDAAEEIKRAIAVAKIILLHGQEIEE